MKHKESRATAAAFCDNKFMVARNGGAGTFLDMQLIGKL
jgi:hypothetical protein